MRRLFLILAVLALCAAVLPAAGAEEPSCVTYRASAPSAAEVCSDDGHQLGVGTAAAEPTLGVRDDGAVFFATTPGSGLTYNTTDRVGSWRVGVSRSDDSGASWLDVTPSLTSPETFDPYLYVDPTTGRVFLIPMFPLLTCGVVSFSDDGGDSWTTNPAGCGPTGFWDHQTMVAAKPRVLTPQGYPNIVHQCVNAMYAAMCSRSLDGGLTWSPSTPAFTAGRSGTSVCSLHGHLAAAPDGTLYLPTMECGGAPAVYVSRDDGLTWSRSVVADVDVPKADPAVAVDAAGNVYFTWADEAGKVWLSASRDGAKTWAPRVPVAPAYLTGILPTITAGDEGQIVVAFPATSGALNPDGSGGDRIRWDGYLTVSRDAAGEDPTFTTIRATDDPLMRGSVCQFSNGRCAIQYDFIDVALTPAGQVLAAMVDGCVDDCAAASGTVNNTNLGVVLTSDDVDLCADRCWNFPR